MAFDLAAFSLASSEAIGGSVASGVGVGVGVGSTAGSVAGIGSGAGAGVGSGAGVGADSPTGFVLSPQLVQASVLVPDCYLMILPLFLPQKVSYPYAYYSTKRRLGGRLFRSVLDSWNWEFQS